MTVWLHLSDTRLDQVGWRIGEGYRFTTPVPGGSVRLHRAGRLCLVLGDHPLVDGDVGGEWLADLEAPRELYVVAVGRIRGSGRPTTTDARVAVDGLLYLPETPTLRAVLRKVPNAPRQIASIRSEMARDLGEETTDDYRNAIDALSPGSGAGLEALLGSAPPTTDSASAAATLAEERDATHLALRIAGIEIDLDDSWAETGSSYLDSLAYEPRESALLAHDATNFGDFELVGGRRPDWQQFTDGEVTLRIANVDMTPLEQTLGVDLIYRHLDADTFVLVQYKRMVKTDGGWVYRVDAQFREQLSRMARVDASDKRKPAASPATWRLNTGACYFKLVAPPTSFDLTSKKTLPGLYLPLEYAQGLLEDDSTLGERDGRIFRWDQVDRYLTTGLFTQLVREGWIGSRGVKTNAIKKLVVASLGSERAVVIAEESGAPPGRARRSRPRRAPGDPRRP